MGARHRSRLTLVLSTRPCSRASNVSLSGGQNVDHHLEELRRYAESDERWFLRGLVVIALVLFLVGFGMVAGPVVAAFLASLVG
jgi:hypothetical protein